MPSLTIFAGPNGSGKSSIIRLTEFAGADRLLEADAIAARLDPNDVQKAAIRAGREVLTRAQEYLADSFDFAIETTLSGSWTTSVIKKAKAQNFLIRVIFVCVDNPERNIKRVRERVSRGGHSVPDEDVRRRYDRSLMNLRHILKLADQAMIFDNSRDKPRQILEFRSGTLVSQSDDLPLWASALLQDVYSLGPAEE